MSALPICLHHPWVEQGTSLQGTPTGKTGGKFSDSAICFSVFGNKEVPSAPGDFK